MSSTNSKSKNRKKEEGELSNDEYDYKASRTDQQEKETKNEKKRQSYNHSRSSSARRRGGSERDKKKEEEGTRDKKRFNSRSRERSPKERDDHQNGKAKTSDRKRKENDDKRKDGDRYEKDSKRKRDEDKKKNDGEQRKHFSSEYDKKRQYSDREKSKDQDYDRGKEYKNEKRKTEDKEKKREDNNEGKYESSKSSKKRDYEYEKKRDEPSNKRRDEENDKIKDDSKRSGDKKREDRSKYPGKQDHYKEEESDKNNKKHLQRRNQSDKVEDNSKQKKDKKAENNSSHKEYDELEEMMREDSENEDERERKKKELLDMIRGVNNNKKAPEPIEEEERVFDNDLINPEDAIDDEEDQDNEIKQEIDGIKQKQISIDSNEREARQLKYLKTLEEMRNKEVKEGLEGVEDSKSEKEENQKQDGENKNEVEQYGEKIHIHDLDDKEDSDSEADMFRDDLEKFVGDKNSNQNGVAVQNIECDDEQNYFKIRIGEILASKYKVIQKCGKGVFANVCKAEQLDNGKLVAIKILRSNEIMHESGEKEREVVQKLNLADKNDKKHIVRLKCSFEHRKHLCLVFECLALNLREALKIYGKGKGFSLDVIRSYAFQIFIAMTHLNKNRLIHADLKPDNLLISEDTKILKMCDFGTALTLEDNGIIKYIQSRFYRAPEVLLGCPPYNQIDIWSIGVTLYEIYTQKYLFDGTTNNEMLKLIMDVRGKFNKKMLQSGQFVLEYFDSNQVFQYIQVDPVTKQKYVTPIKYGDIPKQDIGKLLNTHKEGAENENQKKLSQFKDFLDKCLQLDPKNRITAEDALKHPFLDTQIKSK